MIKMIKYVTKKIYKKCNKKTLKNKVKKLINQTLKNKLQLAQRSLHNMIECLTYARHTLCKAYFMQDILYTKACKELIQEERLLKNNKFMEN